MVKKHIKQVQETENVLVKNGIIVITIFVIAIYSQVISFTFTGFDDDFLVVKNLSELSNWDNVSKIFSGNSFLTNAVYGFYRPLQTLSFMIDAKIFGKELWGFHLTNLLLHLLSCYLLYFVILKLKQLKAISLILTLIFAVHPLFSINVAWLPARGDLLLTVFGLSGFLLLLYYIETKNILFLILQSLAGFLALFSKESAIALPILFFIYYIIKNKKFDKNLIYMTLFWLISGLVWYLLRISSISDLPDNQLFGFVPFISNLQTIPEYIAKFFLPYKIMALPVFRMDITIVGSIIIILVILFFVRSKNSNTDLVLFGTMWFLLLVIPGILYSRLDSNQDFFYQYLDHRSYFATIGLLFLFSSILQTILKKFSQKSFVLLGIGVALVLAVLSFNHTKIYSSPDRFLTQAIEDNEKASVAYFLLANFKKDELNYNEAVRLYTEAISINPNYSEALNNRGSLYAIMSIYDKAIVDLSNAIKLNPKITDGYINRALSFEATEKYPEAIADYIKAIEIQPNDLSIQFSLANCFNSTGNFEKAISIYNRIISKNPENAEAYYNRANSFAAMKQSYKAIQDYTNSINNNPNYGNAFYNRAIERYQSGDKEGACNDWQKAVILGKNEALQMVERYCKNP